MPIGWKSRWPTSFWRQAMRRRQSLAASCRTSFAPRLPNTSVLDPDAAKLWMDSGHRRVEPVAGLGDGGRRKACSAAEQHAVVSAEPPVIEEILRVDQHAAIRNGTLRQLGSQGLGGDDVTP